MASEDAEAECLAHSALPDPEPRESLNIHTQEGKICLRLIDHTTANMPWR